VVPRLFTNDVVGLVNFLKATFHARGEVRHGVPAEIWIGDSVVMVSDGGGIREPCAGFLYVYVEDVEAVYAAAMSTGASMIEAPENMQYGDRRATVQDAWGNIWQIATRRRQR